MQPTASVGLLQVCINFDGPEPRSWGSFKTEGKSSRVTKSAVKAFSVLVEDNARVLRDAICYSLFDLV